MNIFASVLLLSAIIATTTAVALHRRTALPVTPEGGAAERTVIFVVDGATPGDFARTAMPNLQSLARGGTSYDDAWIGQLEPDPAPSGATIGTGVFPRVHGVMGPAWTDPQTGQPSTALDPAQVVLGSIDQVMEAHLVPTLAERIKSSNPASKILSVGGAGCEAAAAAGTWLADYILCASRDGLRWAPGGVAGHRAPPGPLNDVTWSTPIAKGQGLGAAVEGWALGQQDNWVARYATAAIRVLHPRLTIVNFPELGLVGPYVGGQQRKAIVARLMVGVDRGIGNIVGELKREKRFRHTLFVITSGAAMATVSSTVPRKKLVDAINTGGGASTYLLSDGMGMIGVGDPIQAQPVAQAIQGERLLAIDAIYFKSRRGDTWSYNPQYLNPELPPNFGDVAAYLLSTVASNASPDVIVPYSPRVGGDSHTGPYARASVTSGMQWETQHIPLILSGQGVFPGVVSSFPARLVDVAPTIEALMGFNVAKTNGIVLADTMFNPPSDGADHQKAASQRLTPLVQALKQRAQSAGP